MIVHKSSRGFFAVTIAVLTLLFHLWRFLVAILKVQRRNLVLAIAGALRINCILVGHGFLRAVMI